MQVKVIRLKVKITRTGKIIETDDVKFRHRLMCGDSTNFVDVIRLVKDKKIDMIFTDPPYGMNAVSNSGVLSKNYEKDILGDNDNTVAVNAFKATRPLGIKTEVWWGANYYSSNLPDAECWIVWDENNGLSDQTDCELAWTNIRSVVRMVKQASEKTGRVHPTQKPSALLQWVLNRFSLKGVETVLDLFGGSGSTLIACEQLKKRCYMLELDPNYCSVIIQRWESLTGQKANKN